MTQIIIHNIENDSVEIRELTPDELAINKTINDAADTAKIELQAKKQAILDKLGLTEDEAKLLLA